MDTGEHISFSDNTSGPHPIMFAFRVLERLSDTEAIGECTISQTSAMTLSGESTYADIKGNIGRKAKLTDLGANQFHYEWLIPAETPAR